MHPGEGEKSKGSGLRPGEEEKTDLIHIEVHLQSGQKEEREQDARTTHDDQNKGARLTVWKTPQGNHEKVSSILFKARQQDNQTQQIAVSDVEPMLSNAGYALE